MEFLFRHSRQPPSDSLERPELLVQIQRTVMPDDNRQVRPDYNGLSSHNGAYDMGQDKTGQEWQEQLFLQDLG